MQEAERFIQYLRYEKNDSSHTVFAYRNDLREFSVFVSQNYGIYSPSDVDADMVRSWMLSLMENGATSRTVNRKLSSLKSFWRYLLREGAVQVNPLNKIISPKTHKPLPSFLSEGEISTLHSSIADAPSLGDGNDTRESRFTKLRDDLIVEMLLQTGIRRSELISLRLEDVDLAASQLKVTGKRNKQRIIPFGPSLKQQIAGYLVCREQQLSVCEGRISVAECKETSQLSSPLYIRCDGKPLYPMLVYRLVHERLLAAGHVSKSSPHVLRHTFATSMLNNGAEINAVKQLLGHSSLSATEVYTHTTFEQLKKTYRQAHPRSGE